MRKLFAVSLAFLGCSTASTGSTTHSDFAPGPSGASSMGQGSSDGATLQVGTLTAGIWDDSLNFELFTAYRDAQKAPLADFTAEEQLAAAQASRSVATALDITLVIDTTGSMGDEISWLKTDFTAIASDVTAAHPGVPVRWGLVHYRDDGDEYVVRQADFTASVAAYQAGLAALGAGGGGDFPEVPERALAQAAQLSWDATSATGKLIFWIADAPPHDGQASAFSAAVRSLRDSGVHIYPVASSGIDERTEYAMRASAQLTLGRYLFLTDDSGVGDTHKTPSVPCYVVTKLSQAVERVVASELAGRPVAVEPQQVVRAVGGPVYGACTLQDGHMAHLF
jgi:hypothetical protein